MEPRYPIFVMYFREFFIVVVDSPQALDGELDVHDDDEICYGWDSEGCRLKIFREGGVRIAKKKSSECDKDELREAIMFMADPTQTLNLVPPDYIGTDLVALTNWATVERETPRHGFWGFIFRLIDKWEKRKNRKKSGESNTE
jgi:hypothetical protein